MNDFLMEVDTLLFVHIVWLLCYIQDVEWFDQNTMFYGIPASAWSSHFICNLHDDGHAFDNVTF